MAGEGIGGGMWRERGAVGGGGVGMVGGPGGHWEDRCMRTRGGYSISGTGGSRTWVDKIAPIMYVARSGMM